MNRQEMPIRLHRNSSLVAFFVIGITLRIYQKPTPELIAVLYFTGIAYLLCQLYLSYIKKKIQIVVHPLPHYLNKTERWTLEINLSNIGFLPVPYLYIFLKESYHVVPEQIKALCVTLPPHSQKKFTFEMRAKESGEEIIGIEKVILLDFFEVAQRKLPFSHLQPITVLPQPFVLKGVEYLMGQSYNSKKNQKPVAHFLKSQEGEVSYELKPYIEGESQRLMHWKLVAQRDIYMIREREILLHEKKVHLVILDPVICMPSHPLSFYQRFNPLQRVRLKWQEEREKAFFKDKLINSTISYLIEILKNEESISFHYYKENQWQQVSIENKQQLVALGKALSKGVTTEDNLRVRWPENLEGTYTQQLLITIGGRRRTSSDLLQNQGLNILEVQRRSMNIEDVEEQYWYITSTHQIVRSN